LGGGVYAKTEEIQAYKVHGEDLALDKDAADYAVMFIESLCHTKGPGRETLD